MLASRASEHYVYGFNNPISTKDPQGLYGWQITAPSGQNMTGMDDAARRRMGDRTARVAKGIGQGVEGLKELAVGLGYGAKELVTDPASHWRDMKTVASNAPGAVVQNIADTIVEVQRDPGKADELAGEALVDVLAGFLGDKGLRRALKVVNPGSTSAAGASADSRMLVSNMSDPVTDPMAVKRMGQILADDAVASRAYSQIQKAGFEVELDFSPGPAGVAGRTNGPQGVVRIYAGAHSSPRSMVSTVVHESSHVSQYMRGRPIGTLMDEYRAARRQFLFDQHRRPSFAERDKLMSGVVERYAEAEVGN